MSRLTDSAISKRQGDQKKHSFLEEKNTSQKRKGIHYEQPDTSLDGLCCEAIDSEISQNIFSYLKMFSIQSRKNNTVEDNKKD